MPELIKGFIIAAIFLGGSIKVVTIALKLFGSSLITVAGQATTATGALGVLSFVVNSTMVALMPYVAVVAAVTATVFLLAKAHRENNKTLEESQQEFANQRYEVNKTVISLNEMIEAYEKINSKKIETDEDIKALEQLKNQILELQEAEKDLDNGFKATYNEYTGEIDLEKSIKSLSEYRDAQREAFSQTYIDEFYLTLREFPKEVGAAQEQFVKNNKGVFSNFFINELEEIKDIDFSRDEIESLQDFYSEILNTDDIELLKQGNKNIYNEIIKDSESFLEEIEVIREEISSSREKSLGEGLKEYRNKINELLSLQTEYADGIAKILQQENPILEYFRTMFDEEIKTDNIDLDSFDIFTDLGWTEDNFNDFNSAITAAGYSTKGFYEELMRVRDSLISDGVEGPLATSMAFQALGREVDDSKLKLELYGLSAKRNLLEVSQQADLVANKIENINKKQKDFLSGEMSNQELYDFYESYKEIFQDEGL